MFITITNAATLHKGQKTAINTETIVSMWRSDITRDNSTVENITLIFMPPHGTWEAEETVEEIIELINGK